jgi:hypothetical protein
MSPAAGAAAALASVAPAVASLLVFDEVSQPSKQRLAAAITESRSVIIIIGGGRFVTAPSQVKPPR